MNHGRRFRDTLSSVSKPSKIKSKHKKIHVADLGNNLLPFSSVNEDVDDLLSNNDTSSFMLKLDKFKPKDITSVKSKLKEVPCPIIPTKANITPIVDLNIKSITDEASKKDKIESKYKSKGTTFNIDQLQSSEGIMGVIEKYEQLIIDILHGSEPSYFYTLAKRYQSNSKSHLITNDELISIPKSIYYGYIGSKRSNLITFEILKHPLLSKMVQRQEKVNKVIQFWGVDPFVKYVLTPELLAHFVKDSQGLTDLHQAYDLLEDSNDYGMHVSDKTPMMEKEVVSEYSDSEDLIELFNI